MTVIIKPLSRSELTIEVDYKSTPVKDTAMQLFALSAQYFNTFEFDDPKKAKDTYINMAEMGENLRQAIRESILKDPKKENIEYWIDVMNDLFAKGDFSLSIDIGLVLKELEPKRDLQQVFSEVSPEKLSCLNTRKEEVTDLPAFPIGRIMRANFYEKERPDAAIANMQLYITRSSSFFTLTNQSCDISVL